MCIRRGRWKVSGIHAYTPRDRGKSGQVSSHSGNEGSKERQGNPEAGWKVDDHGAVHSKTGREDRTYHPVTQEKE